MTKTVFGLRPDSNQQGCTLYSGHKNVNGLKFRIIELSMLQNKCADQLRGNHIIFKYVLIFVKIISIYMQ